MVSDSLGIASIKARIVSEELHCGLSARACHSRNPKTVPMGITSAGAVTGLNTLVTWRSVSKFEIHNNAPSALAHLGSKALRIDRAEVV